LRNFLAGLRPSLWPLVVAGALSLAYLISAPLTADHGAQLFRIGLVEAYAGFYLPEGFKDVAAYIVVLIMLALKPNGLFGENLRKKV